jgi:glycosyltransferase involved in cell wall biosynthesis
VSAEIGVVIPAYNAEAFLGAAIESVLVHAELIGDVVVVDDGSTDATAEVAAGFGSPVRVFSQANGGIGAARNRGLAEVRGTLLAFLDADDEWTDDALRTRLAVLELRPEVEAVFGWQQSRIGTTPVGKPLPGTLPSAMLIRRASFDRIGPFAEGTAVSEGLDWMLRAREADLREATVPEQVLWRRVHQDNNSLRHRAEIGEFARTLKASVDRRRAAGQA